ncbi:MAG: ester cyclase [Polyangiaceae bacterium]|nr:ester cyclase [Polyangiaceae bacterium]
MGTDNVAIVRRHIEEVWNKGNFAVEDELIAPNLRYHDSMSGEATGKDAHKNFVRTMRTACPDVTCTINQIGMANGSVFVRFTARGTNKGSLFGMPATGKAFTIRGNSIIKLENGKITEIDDAWDTYGFLSQLGLVPTLDKLPRQAGATARA